MKRRLFHRETLQRAFDTIFATALATVAIVEIWMPLPSVAGTGPRELSTTVAVLLCLALTFRRVWPLPTALVVTLVWPVVFSIQPILILFWGQLLPLAIATYSVARHGTRRASLIGAVAAASCLVFFDLRVEPLQEPGEIIFHWLVLIAAWLIGQMVRTAERRATESQRRATEIEVQSRTATLAAITDERARIARELHDIVAHAVSMMVVQAGAAEQVAADDPNYTRRALATIRTTGTDALAEMRSLLAILRDDEHGSLSPQPGLDDLSALLDDSRTAGLDVEFEVEGDPRMLPAGVDLAAYRIVQEALTNVRRHAAATRVDVLVRHTAEAIEVEVRDDGRGFTGQREGHGLIGMRERVALYGGTLTTENAADYAGGSGFRVHAVLPVAAHPSTLRATRSTDVAGPVA
ncbi:sensor histidine kinase [Diaminobutyricimonas sp. TR449]|uniref:sensor histidine kinase n=1 Tax=Diaminobutyricimonas sp. TR449 TaxID=2708076 RepID=UPI00141DB309|nr:sensor histidine kinase [Diaminobutyricimonas sp. TR449]